MRTKMKRAFALMTWPAAIMLLALACNDSLDIIQDYGYRIETLPLPKTLKPGETVDLEFSIVREGFYSGTTYKFRYFQTAGEGSLSYKGKAISMNRFQEIDSDNFVLVYQSLSENRQQQLDFVFENSFGRRVEYSIAFGGESTDKEESELQKISLYD
jgi:hypothetical protein